MRLQTKVNIILGLLMMFCSSLALALGFGEIKLNSSLNQPLDAEIELINVRDLTKREIIVGLASLDDYKRAGVDKTYFLSEFKFNVDLNSKTGPVVFITTTDPVKEPFLNFILYAQWPSGKLLREYTLLVDLPVFSGAKASPVRVATKEAPQTVAKPVNREASAPTNTKKLDVADPVNSDAEKGFDAEVYGPVSSNDTLWAIAAKVRPDSSYSIQQTMLAIQRLNPKAFINNNINLLKRGQVLRVPDGQEIREWSAREAIKEVAGQNDLWSADGDTTEGAQLEGSKNYAETKTEVSEVEGRVKLSASASVNDEGVAQGAQDDGMNGAPVDQELDLAQEELDAVSREKTELSSRLSALDEQIDTMEKLVEVSNDELLALELAAKQANNAEESQAPSEAIAVVDPEVEVTSSEDTQSQTEIVPITEETVKPVVQAQQPEPQKSIVDLLMENITYLVAGFVVLVSGIAIFLFMRNRDDGFDDDFDDELDDFSTFETDDLSEAPTFDTGEDPTQGEDATEVLNPPVESIAEVDVPAEAETEDVVGECDIHLAYGQYDQAEEKLIKALEQEPANPLVRLKLLEVLSAQGDAQGFDSHYAKLLLLNDSEVTQRANSLREGVIDIGPFDISKHDTSDFSALIGIEDATVVAKADSAEQNLDLSNDTLDFTSSEEIEEPELTLDPSGEDDTVVTVEVEEALSLDSDDAVAGDELTALLDGEDDTLVEALESELSDELVLEGEFGSSDDQDLDDFDLGDLDLDLGDDDIVGDLNDDLDDVEFDLSSDMDGDDLASEFAGNLVAEKAVTSSLEEDDLNFEGDDSEGETLELDEQEIDLTDETSALSDSDADLDIALVEEKATELSLESEEMDLSDLGEVALDLDADLAELGDVDLSSSEEVLESEDGVAGSELDSLDLESMDLESMDLESMDLDSSDLESSDLESSDLESSDLDVSKSEATAKSKESDFDVTFNLDDGLNLDELDQELDELASPSASDDELDAIAGLDLDDIDAEDLAAQPESEELGDIASDLNVSEPSDSLGDLQAEAANEIEVTESDIVETSEFDAHSDFEIPDFDPDSDDDSNLDFLSDNDETATKLDLARAYIDMGDADGAKDILDEILEEGTDGQRKDAEGLLKKLA